MDPISDFSAAPHLPHSLRTPNQTPLARPECLLGSLLASAKHLKVFELKGEIYIEVAEAA